MRRATPVDPGSSGAFRCPLCMVSPLNTATDIRDRMIDTTAMWTGFIVLVAVLLVLDLGVFNRGSKHISVRKAVYLTLFWISLAVAFGAFVYIEMGADKAAEYFAGYVVEKAMSVDNLFVFILIFGYFAIPDEYQHKALFYGIVGALLFRAVFVFAGVELLERFHFIMYIFGAFLIYAAIKTMLKKEEGGGNRISKIMSRWIKTSPELDGDRFFTVKNGVRIGTPLLLCVIVIELTDIVFALDSIPAILAITTDSFIVYTSNIFAILGLRSLYFAIRGSLNSLVYLKYGLGIVLAFVGIKMLVSEFAEISVAASLAFIGSVLLVTIAASVIASRRKSLPDV